MRIRTQQCNGRPLWLSPWWTSWCTKPCSTALPRPLLGQTLAPWQALACWQRSERPAAHSSSSTPEAVQPCQMVQTSWEAQIAAWWPLTPSWLLGFDSQRRHRCQEDPSVSQLTFWCGFQVRVQSISGAISATRKLANELSATKRESDRSQHVLCHAVLLNFVQGFRRFCGGQALVAVSTGSLQAQTMSAFVLQRNRIPSLQL